MTNSTEEYPNNLYNDDNNIYPEHKASDISHADAIKKFLSTEASALGYLRWVSIT